MLIDVRWIRTEDRSAERDKFSLSPVLAES
jgi:hypothetical protein